MFRRPWFALGAALIVATAPAAVLAHSTSSATVRWVSGDAAPTVGLIGDSTLSGVRWADEYGDLQRFNFLFDAESCRRTVETSCWSREQYRPANAITTLREHTGEWGDVLVMMTGYNDSSGGFTDGVEAIVDEAREQGIGAVVWLSLRTRGVDYEEPLHLANGSTYREANRSLYELAADTDGYLQIADWATHSADHPEWFEPDGAHLAPAGVDPLTDFIAAQLDVVLAGGTVTPDPTPWEEIREGDEGELVVQVQEALLAAGVAEVAAADGVYGPQTATAISTFQRQAGLPETGAVDEATAVELGLYTVPPPVTTTVPSTTIATTVAPPTTMAELDLPTAGQGAGGSGDGVWWLALALALVPAVGWFAWRRPRLQDSATPD